MDLSDMIDEQDKEIAALKAKLARVDGCVDGPIMMSSEAFQAVEDIRAILSAEPKVLVVYTYELRTGSNAIMLTDLPDSVTPEIPLDIIVLAKEVE